jgi:hypothetical protein
MLELMMYVAILSIIMFAFLRAMDQAKKAKLVSIARTVRQINESATIVYATTGDWPADVWNSIMPPEMAPYLSNNIFQNDTPIGGRWDWNGADSAVSDSIGIAIRFNPSGSADLGLLTELDTILDDGNLSTGLCRGTVYTGKYFYVIEVAKE